MTETFASLSPATGKPVGHYSVDGPEEVRAAVERARAALPGWAQAGWQGRRTALLAFKHALASRADEIAEAIGQETGKPRGDARGEVLMAVVHLDWAARNARKVLGRRRVSPGLLSVHQRALLAYRPLGVIGVIGPWNYPVYTPMGSLGYALAAGNGVVFKPSELTPGVGVLLAKVFGESVPRHAALFQTVTGPGSTGEALARSGVDKVAFTGSAATARKVAAVCAESLTPLSAEGGGKDAVLVDGDLDGAGLDEAADAIVWGAMSNAGQTCAAVERVYAVESVHEALVERVVRRARELRTGDESEENGEQGHFGALTLPRQIGVVERHVKDALASGAHAPLGGPESVRPPYVHPIVLVDVPEDSPAMREETFGPVVAINKVHDLDEGVRKANASAYALAGSVFTANRRKGLQIAGRLRAGAISVGSVVGFAAIPSLPFGGSDESGYGRLHGAEGLRSFASARSITVRRFRPPADLTSYATPPAKAARAVDLALRLHARR